MMFSKSRWKWQNRLRAVIKREQWSPVNEGELCLWRRGRLVSKVMSAWNQRLRFITWLPILQTSIKGYLNALHCRNLCSKAPARRCYLSHFRTRSVEVSASATSTFLLCVTFARTVREMQRGNRLERLKKKCLKCCFEKTKATSISYSGKRTIITWRQ